MQKTLSQYKGLKVQPGLRFGKLTVVKRDGTSKDGCAVFLCQCDCGATTHVQSTYLTTGSTTSCGCIRKTLALKQLRKAQEAIKTHGMSRDRVYWSWQHMKDRCYNYNNPKYKDYGARGIAVCDEWLNSQVFIDWALANGYRESLTLDRIDVSGNYEPTNCRWATPKEQANNRRHNLRITHQGKTKTLYEWAREKGLSVNTVRARWYRGGKRTFEELFAPVRKG